MCNKEIKFKAFLDHAQGLGAERIATGHYVRSDNAEDGYTRLLRGLDANKDQSYFLYALDQYQLSHALFPLGGLDKSEVRNIARQQGFDVFNKKDSTGICFIGERKFKDFLQRFIPAQPGIIESIDEHVLGEHSGLMYYTIGQRQGLGIGGTELGCDEPWYVIEKDLESNRLIVAQGHDHAGLFYTHCSITDLHWIAQQMLPPFTCTAKIRYRQADQVCTITGIENDNAVVHFKEAQRAITPGQALVFYQDEVCLGGGTIEQAFNNEF